MIRFVDVSAGYGTEQEPVFTHFSETIEDGEFVLVTGESGVGKSTFVRLLLCELLPLAGQVFVDGQDLSLLKRGQIPVYRRKLGVVFQDHRLIPDRSAYENVKLARLVAGGRRRDTDQMICSLFSLFDITELYKRYPNEMSGGQQQKVCLARAVMNYPRYLLADEPTGNLDPESSREIMKFFELVHRQGTTVIVVTHDLEAADGLACRRIELS